RGHLVRHPDHRARARAAAPGADDLSRRRRSHGPCLEPVGRPPALPAGGRRRLRRHRVAGPERVHRRPDEDDPGTELRGDSEAGPARARAGARPRRDGGTPAGRRAAVAPPRSAPARRPPPAQAFRLARAPVYPPLWFLRLAPSAQTLLAEFPRIAAWRARVEALGEG